MFVCISSGNYYNALTVIKKCHQKGKLYINCIVPPIFLLGPPSHPITAIYLYISTTPRNNAVSGDCAGELMTNDCVLEYTELKVYRLGNMELAIHGRGI